MVKKRLLRTFERDKRTNFSFLSLGLGVRWSATLLSSATRITNIDRLDKKVNCDLIHLYCRRKIRQSKEAPWNKRLITLDIGFRDGSGGQRKTSFEILATLPLLYLHRQSRLAIIFQLSLMWCISVSVFYLFNTDTNDQVFRLCGAINRYITMIAITTNVFGYAAYGGPVSFIAMPPVGLVLIGIVVRLCPSAVASMEILFVHLPLIGLSVEYLFFNVNEHEHVE